MESFLKRNLTKYPKLSRLMDTDVADRSKFLRDIKNSLSKIDLSYNQALAACTVIDEKSKNVRD